jgi:hypothetical protein
MEGVRQVRKTKKSPAGQYTTGTKMLVKALPVRITIRGNVTSSELKVLRKLWQRMEIK